MSGRIIKQKTNQNLLVLNFEFPLDKDGAVYVRQSSLVQVKTNIHSFEMQTDKFVEHFRNTGCTGHIEVIADDEALSGTLAIHARPGMTRMMKLIEDGKVGWIGAVAVNRFTRDKWLITPGVLMKTCHDHNVWIATLRMNFNFKDDYCQRVFMLEAEEAARHLEWMKLVLGGGLRTASSHGYYDGRWIVPGYIVDRTDPLRKKYIVYEPHARVVRWLFKRFLQLEGDLPALCREVQKMPYLFPKFESWVEPINVSGFSLERHNKNEQPSKTLEGYYKPRKYGLISILTNPVYIGWWLPLDGGVIENNHEAVIEDGLFTYAHKQLSTHDFNGERQKPARVIRYGKVEALLKKVLKDETGQAIYPSPDRGGLYRCNEYDGYTAKHRFMAPVSVIDSTFLEKFFERLQGSWNPGYEDWLARIQERQQSKQGTKQELKRQINEAQRQKRETMDILDDKDIPKTKQMKIYYANKIVGLEAQIAEWEAELNKPDSEDDEEAIIEIDKLINEVVAEWKNFPFKKRMRFVNALVKDVILSRPAPGWLAMEIRWKRPDWAIEGCFLRCTANREVWTPEEDETVRGLYAAEKAGVIMKALSDKTWNAIEHRARKLGVWKETATDFQELGFKSNREIRNLCWSDIQFAGQHGLSPCAKTAQWFRR